MSATQQLRWHAVLNDCAVDLGDAQTDEKQNRQHIGDDPFAHRTSKRAPVRPADMRRHNQPRRSPVTVAATDCSTLRLRSPRPPRCRGSGQNGDQSTPRIATIIAYPVAVAPSSSFHSPCIRFIIVLRMYKMRTPPGCASIVYPYAPKRKCTANFARRMPIYFPHPTR